MIAAIRRDALSSKAAPRNGGNDGESAGESILTAMLSSAPFLIDEALEVIALLDLLSPVPTGLLRGDDVVAATMSLQRR